MNEPTCAFCIHFRPHYIQFDEDRYSLIPCGHCVYPRLKHRQATSKGCIHFSPLPPKEREKDTP